jgi:hypothetical protein
MRGKTGGIAGNSRVFRCKDTKKQRNKEQHVGTGRGSGGLALPQSEGGLLRASRSAGAMRYGKLRSQVRDASRRGKAGSIREGTRAIYEPLFKKSSGGRNVKKMGNRKLEMDGRKREEDGLCRREFWVGILTLCEK